MWCIHTARNIGRIIIQGKTHNREAIMSVLRPTEQRERSTQYSEAELDPQEWYTFVLYLFLGNCFQTASLCCTVRCGSAITTAVPGRYIKVGAAALAHEGTIPSHPPNHSPIDKCVQQRDNPGITWYTFEQQRVQQRTVVVFGRRTGGVRPVSVVAVLCVASLPLGAEPFCCAVWFCFFRNQLALNTSIWIHNCYIYSDVPESRPPRDKPT